jgi:hypothetical protein
MRLKSSYEILMERLQKENKLTILSAEESFDLLTGLNAKMAAGEADIKQKELEAEQELSSLLLNA